MKINKVIAAGSGTRSMRDAYKEYERRVDHEEAVANLIQGIFGDINNTDEVCASSQAPLFPQTPKASSFITTEEFVSTVSTIFDETKDLFIKKNNQYKTSDPIANFTSGASLLYGCKGNTVNLDSIIEALKAYMAKHVVHVYNNKASGPKIEESFKDIAVYSIIALSIIKLLGTKKDDSEPMFSKEVLEEIHSKNEALRSDMYLHDLSTNIASTAKVIKNEVEEELSDDELDQALKKFIYLAEKLSKEDEQSCGGTCECQGRCSSDTNNEDDSDDDDDTPELYVLKLRI